MRETTRAILESIGRVVQIRLSFTHPIAKNVCLGMCLLPVVIFKINQRFVFVFVLFQNLAYPVYI